MNNVDFSAPQAIFFQTTSYCEDFLMKIAFRIPSNITVYNHQKPAYNPQKTAYNPPDFLLKPHISQTAYKPKILLKPHIRQPVLYAYMHISPYTGFGVTRAGRGR